MTWLEEIWLNQEINFFKFLEIGGPNNNNNDQVIEPKQTTGLE